MSGTCVSAQARTALIGSSSDLPSSVSRYSTRERLGAMFADVLLLDQQAFPAQATALGWAPVRPTLVEELRDASGRQFAER
ncbi:MAG TPA: hypothetical protein VGC18_16110 [Lacisediminihabitans sp.]|uniref:hypothetical protein n=1 Tax=Lacisediminihabitans sp. TaxID=2787631 RepID=UPI002ED9E0F0